LKVAKCDFEDGKPAVTVSVAAIDEMLSLTDTLWGTALPYYYEVANSPDAVSMPLEQAVASVEGAPWTERFLVVAYQDGGLITVSGVILPFQAGARKAEWWGPYRSAVRAK
jgi:hypothetical protein